jgi:hypothetical protein
MKPERPALPSTLRARAEALTALWPAENKRRLGFGSLGDVLRFLELELGRCDALEAPQATQAGSRIALAPRSIYHLCAANLDVSSESSLFLGLLLGSRLWFKLPGSGLPGFAALVRGLPPPWSHQVALLAAHDPGLMRESDAVVLFGSDAAVESVRGETRPGQRVLAYGHKTSAGLVLPGCATKAWAEKAAREISDYGQSGCLSPQIYLCSGQSDAERFAEHLAAALPSFWQDEPPDFATAAAILAARDHALLRGSRLWTPGPGTGWTVELAAGAVADSGPGHGYIRVAAESDPWAWLCRQRPLSALSITQEPLEAGWLARAAGAQAPFSRLCPTGRLQQPPLEWPHDGRPRLADLLRWISLENA